MTAPRGNSNAPAAVKALRLRHGLTQEALGERPGLGRVFINAIERGANQCRSGDTQAALASGFGLTLELFRNYLNGNTSVDDAYAMSTWRTT